MSNFLRRDSWREIERSYIFDAAIFYPSDTKRPLKFFVPSEEDENKGTLITAIGDFKPKHVDGRWQAIEQQVVVNLKPRKVVVLSNNEINHNEEFEYILVAPIMSVHEHDKKKSWYQRMKADNHPFFLHLPETVTGRECYVDLSELTSIHKGMLLNKLNCVPDERLDVLHELLSECLDLGIISEDEITKETGTDN